MSAPDTTLDQFQSGDPLVMEALRQPMYARIEAHLVELARHARVTITSDSRHEITWQAFEAACANHSRYLPQYASLESWFLKHTEGFALAFANQRADRAPLVLTILFSYASLLDRDIERRFPMIDAEDRSDLVFQSLLAGYDRAQSFDPQRGMIESWLRGQATFQALTFLRKHHHGQVRGPNADEQIAQVLAPNPLTDLAARLESEIQPELQPRASDLEPLLAALPGRTADAIRRYLHGESYEQIAEHMGLSHGHARVLIHRGRHALQEQGAAIRLHLDGHTMDEIARTLGLTPRRIRRHLNLSSESLQVLKRWLNTGGSLITLLLVIFGIGVGPQIAVDLVEPMVYDVPV